MTVLVVIDIVVVDIWTTTATAAVTDNVVSTTGIIVRVRAGFGAGVVPIIFFVITITVVIIIIVLDVEHDVGREEADCDAVVVFGL